MCDGNTLIPSLVVSLMQMRTRTDQGQLLQSTKEGVLFMVDAYHTKHPPPPSTNITTSTITATDFCTHHAHVHATSKDGCYSL